MRRPRLAYHVVREVETPLQVPRRSVARDSDLLSILCAISPDKTAYWQSRDCSRLVVNAFPRGPFGPSIEQASGLLGLDLTAVINSVHGRFAVEIIALGVPTENRSAAANCRYASHVIGMQRLLVVDVRELLLLGAAMKGEFPDGVLVSCLSSTAHTHGFWVPRGTPLGDVLKTDSGLAERFDGIGPAPELIHGVSGAKLRGDEPCGVRTEFVCFADSQMQLVARPSFLFPFPVFNRSFAVVHADTPAAHPTPCSNCLACTSICPAGVRPSFLYHNAAAGALDECGKLGIAACIQCGWCSLACPSSLPLHDELMCALDELAAEEDA